DLAHWADRQLAGTQPIERDGVADRVRSARNATELDQVRGAARMASEVAAKRADVRPAAAADPRGQVRSLACEHRPVMHHGRRWREIERVTAARGGIGPHPGDLLRRIRRRLLIERAGEL